jgi:hypothetical protein
VRRIVFCLAFLLASAATAQGLPQTPSLLPVIIDVPGCKQAFQLARAREALRQTRQRIADLEAQPGPGAEARRREDLPSLASRLRSLELEVRDMEEVRRLQATPPRLRPTPRTVAPTAASSTPPSSENSLTFSGSFTGPPQLLPMIPSVYQGSGSLRSGLARRPRLAPRPTPT